LESSSRVDKVAKIESLLATPLAEEVRRG